MVPRRLYQWIYSVSDKTPKLDDYCYLDIPNQSDENALYHHLSQDS